MDVVNLDVQFDHLDLGMILHDAFDAGFDRSFEVSVQKAAAVFRDPDDVVLVFVRSMSGKLDLHMRFQYSTFGAIRFHPRADARWSSAGVFDRRRLRHAVGQDIQRSLPLERPGRLRGFLGA